MTMMAIRSSISKRRSRGSQLRTTELECELSSEDENPHSAGEVVSNVESMDGVEDAVESSNRVTSRIATRSRSEKTICTNMSCQEITILGGEFKETNVESKQKRCELRESAES